MKFVTIRVVSMCCVRHALMANQEGFGKKCSSSTSTRSNLEGICLQYAANCVNFVFGKFVISPLMPQPVDNELLITVPQRGNILTNFIMRFHLINLPPFFWIDLLQQKTSYTQNWFKNKSNVFFITVFQIRSQVMLFKWLTLPRAVTIFLMKARTNFRTYPPAAVGASDDRKRNWFNDRKKTTKTNLEYFLMTQWQKLCLERRKSWLNFPFFVLS